MVRFFTSLVVTVVIMTMIVIAWTPIAKGGQPPPVFLTCADYCNDQIVCQCAKILGGSLRLTQCNNDSTCEDTCSSFDCGTQCICTPDPACKLWEKDVVSQSFPVLFPNAENCFYD